MTKILFMQGDIASVSADAIVNAANARMMPGGGVDGALNRAAGPGLAKAMAKVGPVKTGKAVGTSAFGLDAIYVIHAVGPIYSHYLPEKAEELLRSAYRSALEWADAYRCARVAMPLLSSGVYGYPVKESIRICIEEISALNAKSVKEVCIVAFDEATYKLVQKAVEHGA